MSDGGQITLDWTLPTQKINLAGTFLHNKKYPYEPSKDTKIMLILHGLTGGSECNYIHDLIDFARDAGYRVVVMNQRGVNQPLKNHRIFHGGFLDDLEAALDHISTSYPNAPLLTVGTSFGANQLIRHLGERGEDTKIVGAVALSAPFDLGVCMERMENTIYEDFVLKTYFEKNFLPNMDVLLPFTESKGISFKDIAKIKHVREFHQLLSIQIYDHHKNVDDYLHSFKIQNHHVEGIRIPLLIINARDDPVAVKDCVPVETLSKNPNIITAETARGGHLCWFEGLKPKRVEFCFKLLSNFCSGMESQPLSFSRRF